MSPIETLFLTIGIIFTAVGLVRGYARELGNSIVFMGAVFLLAFLEDQIEGLIQRSAAALFSIECPCPDNPELNQLLALTFIILFISIVFASYAGRTFDYASTGQQQSSSSGQSSRGTRRSPNPLFSLGVGLLNGYLIAGTIWYYLDRYNYPFGDVRLPLSATAQTLVEYLPQRLFPTPTYWVIPVVLLILLRVRG